ncbi:hypothetical protein [Spongiibacter tropicus]|uniref:hypothetical protein n=1 Tax=Spongiibacter tropicus TaxID=454602 RepID=UPI002357781D|nr:hypothetical protein [Spongiibacter tropicus]|tara:strand:- start:67 stop:237 length:171 start_codon:yes stop_codon:yes gene_type:complete
MNLFGTKTKVASSTPLSDFLRNASSGEKKKVYARVISQASERQREVIAAYTEKASA